MSQKIHISPFEVLLWNFRHSGKDIIKIYSKFSPMMHFGADTQMLNFGMWKNSTSLADAQREMSEYVSGFGDFQTANKILDVGSGFCIPAQIWNQKFSNLEIHCMDLNFGELRNGINHTVSQVNCSAVEIPFTDNSFDRIIALESAQHFIPLEKFFAESRRLLRESGSLIMAIPVTNHSFLRLGLLGITWLSKKYSKSYVYDVIKQAGFEIKKQESIGHLVYEPFANYYIQNRQELKEKLIQIYSTNVENLVFKSMKKMGQLSKNKIIDYILLSMEKN